MDDTIVNAPVPLGTYSCGVCVTFTLSPDGWFYNDWWDDYWERAPVGRRFRVGHGFMRGKCRWIRLPNGHIHGIHGHDGQWHLIFTAQMAKDPAAFLESGGLCEHALRIQYCSPSRPLPELEGVYQPCASCGNAPVSDFAAPVARSGLRRDGEDGPFPWAAFVDHYGGEAEAEAAWAAAGEMNGGASAAEGPSQSYASAAKRGHKVASLCRQCNRKAAVARGIATEVIDEPTGTRKTSDVHCTEVKYSDPTGVVELHSTCYALTPAHMAADVGFKAFDYGVTVSEVAARLGEPRYV